MSTIKPFSLHSLFRRIIRIVFLIVCIYMCVCSLKNISNLYCVIYVLHIVSHVKVYIHIYNCIHLSEISWYQSSYVISTTIWRSHTIRCGRNTEAFYGATQHGGNGNRGRKMWKHVNY